MGDVVDLNAVKQMQQKTWSEGDFAMVAGLIVKVAEDLAEALEIVPGEKVLDVACGSGNGAIAAARRARGNVVGTDYVPALLERGRERAAVERLEVEFVEGDAESLPFDDAEFDVTMSIFGAMFAPDHRRCAAELLRVTKPGGRIGLASWVPDGGVGRMFQTMAKHAPPPPGVESPLLWGTEEHLNEIFDGGIADLKIERKPARQSFPSAGEYLGFFRRYFGPMIVAFERVGSEGEAALEADMLAYLEESNTAGDQALVIEPDYIEVVATRA